MTRHPRRTVLTRQVGAWKAGLVLVCLALAACSPEALQPAAERTGPTNGAVVETSDVPSASDDLARPAHPSADPTAAPSPPVETLAPSTLAEISPVGAPTDVALEVMTGDVWLNETGEVLEGVDLRGCIHVRADQVVIRNSRIRCDKWNVITFAEGVIGGLVERVELDGMGAAANGIKGGDGLTVRSSDIHSADDGIKIGSRSEYIGNHIHDLTHTDQSHNDGMQMLQGDSVVIERNYIENVDGVSALMIKTDKGPIQDVTIRGNNLSGGAFTVYVVDAEQGYGPPVAVELTDNLFAEDGRFGSLRLHGLPQVADNRSSVTGREITPPDDAAE